MKKAAFLDRDGVINRKAPGGGYITCVEDLHILPGVSEAIALLNRAGLLAVVVTNQRCIAMGLLTAEGLSQIHNKMTSDLAAAGAHLDAIYFCPHDVDPPCDCRKPSPGMLLAAAGQHGIDLANSWMIGDSASDSQAGKHAGCRTITLASQAISVHTHPDLVADSLLDAVRKLLSLP